MAMALGTSPKAPWHLWAVGVVSLLWNGFGAFDYLMSVTRNPAYMASFPPEMIDILDAFPLWANAAWAIGIWASLLGSLLLLLRSRLAAPAFLLSLAGAAVSFLFQLTLDMPESMGVMMTRVLPLVIMGLIVLQWWYARSQTARGVLR
jgi:hypothetical protein